MAVHLKQIRKNWFLCLFGLIVLGFVWTPEPSHRRETILLHQELDNIPNNIFQLLFNNGPAPTGHALHQRLGESVQSWVQTNPEFSYTLLNNDGANEFAAQQYASQPHILSTFLNIRIAVLRADLFRYMVIASKGGYYGDVDTTLYKPIMHWIPSAYRQRIKFVVGIEYDQLDNPMPSHGFSEHISFAQWTFAASKGHPILTTVIDTVVDALNDYAKKKGTTIAALDVLEQTVGLLTGPQIWTNAVFKGLSKAVGEKVTWENVTGIVEPRLFGDILLLPVDAFGTGQPHSGASQDIIDATYVRHQWKMSWRHLNEDGSMKAEAG